VDTLIFLLFVFFFFVGLCSSKEEPLLSEFFADVFVYGLFELDVNYLKNKLFQNQKMKAQNPNNQERK